MTLLSSSRKDSHLWLMLAKSSPPGANLESMDQWLDTVSATIYAQPRTTHGDCKTALPVTMREQPS